MKCKFHYVNYEDALSWSKAVITFRRYFALIKYMSRDGQSLVEWRLLKSFNKSEIQFILTRNNGMAPRRETFVFWPNRRFARKQTETLDSRQRWKSRNENSTVSREAFNIQQ